ncbi:caspase activity and apoptosis inhibitor 1 isoform X1 [Tachysurus fulvidraco]|uniref:caspase activity and apoptosis inhibitor 1 isoform X1 n=1 Tax=Tachysurus fulvidraco TaxID=1234273 RepID=UPI001FEF35E5|nr:caspase activity and apoptosis inhibitor 1 isoform X1 [Tachysurus fulvidraco]
MKSAKEKKRKHSRRESADGDRKKRNTESSVGEPKEEQHHVQELKEEPSDIEEGGLDLTVPFKPISDYLSNRQEMLEQCFNVLGQNKLKKMLPDELKGCTFMEIKTLCWDQLEQLSEKNLLQILEGKEVTANSEAEEKETNRTSADSQQDNSVDSTSSMKENAEEDKQGLSGEESDVLSINADMNDSDIEGHKDPKPQEEQIPVPMVMPPLSSDLPPEADLESDEPKLELQDDIDKSVSEILAVTDHSSEDAQIKLRPQEVAMEAAPASFPVPAAAPSAQQLALLELEMRARAIKALMKANEVKK